MIMELLKSEEFTYSADKEAGNAEGTLIDYLKGRGIITDLGEDKYKINVEVLLGRAGSTGNGTDGKDIYTLEKANDEGTLGKKETKIKAMTIATNPETKSSDSSIIKYDVKYYNSDGVAEKVGELVDLNKVELITFYIEGQQYTAEKGMTWKEWVESEYNTGDYYGNYWILRAYYGDNFVCSPGDTDLTEDDKVYVSDAIIPDAKYRELHTTVECVSPTSKISTTTDGKYTLAKDLSVGDQIAYYDFATSSTKVGTVENVYIHKKATNFVRYEFSDGTYLEATDYHPIYTKEGWKSLTRRNNYPVPCEGDSVKTLTGWKEITNIETYTGVEDFYDFSIVAEDGSRVQNYFANGALVQSSL